MRKARLYDLHPLICLPYSQDSTGSFGGIGTDLTPRKCGGRRVFSLIARCEPKTGKSLRDGMQYQPLSGTNSSPPVGNYNILSNYC